MRAEYLLTIISAPNERNPSERNLEVCATQSVCLNDKFLVAQYSYSIEEDSFEFELGSAIAIYRMDSLHLKPKYLKYIHAEKNMVADYSTMIEAGSSPFLVSWSSKAGKSSIILLNLETKQQLLHVRLRRAIKTSFLPIQRKTEIYIIYSGRYFPPPTLLNKFKGGGDFSGGHNMYIPLTKSENLFKLLLYIRCFLNHNNWLNQAFMLTPLPLS